MKIKFENKNAETLFSLFSPVYGTPLKKRLNVKTNDGERILILIHLILFDSGCTMGTFEEKLKINTKYWNN